VSTSVGDETYCLLTLQAYPADVVLGPSLFSIPAEELFFFVIQTYIVSSIQPAYSSLLMPDETTVLQILLNKPVLLVTYLQNESTCAGERVPRLRLQKRIGQAILAAGCFGPFFFPLARTATYMSLISLWACPVLLMLWTFAYQLLLGLPWTKTWLPVAIPTLYLWIVDTLALRRGTWAISSGTKLGICIWPHLEIEEAVFFLITNMLVVWGSCAFDNSIAIIDAFPDQFPHPPGLPSPVLMIKSLMLPTAAYDTQRLDGLHHALKVLAKKSRSFYLASGVFAGRLRLDLILLYSFCRVADDLIDDAPNAQEATEWIKSFTDFLDATYGKDKNEDRLQQALGQFPPTAQSILRLLPAGKVPSSPLYSLLEGFKIDLQFSNPDCAIDPPIKTAADLERYASCVASTIGELCLSLVYHHDPDREKSNSATIQDCVAAGARMGRALQYVNIVRDVATDARDGRCYIPEDWFNNPKSTWPHSDSSSETLQFRRKILDLAFKLYAENRDAIEDLPDYARDGIRVAVESYMEIGRVLRERVGRGEPLDFAGGGKSGRASVPRLRRIWVGWRTMAGRRGRP
jgi:15-cis-phytoene synthase / lycopene beta-cyclase